MRAGGRVAVRAVRMLSLARRVRCETARGRRGGWCGRGGGRPMVEVQVHKAPWKIEWKTRPPEPGRTTHQYQTHTADTPTPAIRQTSEMISLSARVGVGAAVVTLALANYNRPAEAFVLRRPSPSSSFPSSRAAFPNRPQNAPRTCAPHHFTPQAVHDFGCVAGRRKMSRNKRDGDVSCSLLSESDIDAAIAANDGPKRNANSDTRRLLSTAYTLAAISTVASWVKCSLTALKSHPDPALEAICGTRHNLLTMGQAFCLPLPLTLSVFRYLILAIENDELENTTSRRLNLGLGVSSAWLGSAALFTPLFSCGYTLYSDPLRYAAAAAHYLTSALCLATWSSSVSRCSKGLGAKFNRLISGVTGSIWSLRPKECSDDPETEEGSDGRNEFATCTFLFFVFGTMPLVAPFPLATIPAILGRRISRAATAWTFLAAVVSYSLKDAVERGESLRDGSSYDVLRKGLTVGSFLHLALVALKLIGVDGGGLILPGDGLWKVYPMMLKEPFAGIMAILTYCLAIIAGMKAN